jgi:hypothetical protein
MNPTVADQIVKPSIFFLFTSENIPSKILDPIFKHNYILVENNILISLKDLNSRAFPELS